MTSNYPANGEHVIARVIKWYLSEGSQPCLTALDAEGRKYIHWLNDDTRWDNIWKEKVGIEGLFIKLRCGKKIGSRGLTSFAVELVDYVPVQEPKPVTRSPLDVFTAKGYDVTPMPVTPMDVQLDDTLESIKKHRPKPRKPHALTGQPTLTPDMTTRMWAAADALNIKLAEATNLCLKEGRTPEALIASRGI